MEEKALSERCAHFYGQADNEEKLAECTGPQRLKRMRARAKAEYAKKRAALGLPKITGHSSNHPPVVAAVVCSLIMLAAIVIGLLDLAR